MGMELSHSYIKKRTADQWSAPAGEELVVISYEILIAKIRRIFETAKYKRRKMIEIDKISNEKLLHSMQDGAGNEQGDDSHYEACHS